MVLILLIINLRLLFPYLGVHNRIKDSPMSIFGTKIVLITSLGYEIGLHSLKFLLYKKLKFYETF